MECMSELPFTEIFRKCEPFYLMIGVTLDEYWNKDVWIAHKKLKVYRLKQDEINNQYWLLGRYFYDALRCVAPSFNTLKPQEAYPYMDKPYNLKNNPDMETQIDKENKKQKTIQDRLKTEMDALIVRDNLRKKDKA